jgi:hypothetical protein
MGKETERMSAVKNAIMDAMEQSETLEQALAVLAGRGLKYDSDDSMMQEIWDAMQEEDRGRRHRNLRRRNEHV